MNNKRDKIEIARNILNNAAYMNMSKEVLLKISQKIDKYIIEYFRKGGEGGLSQGEDV
ncbi:aspartyl-phosphate phosphatase Spo0E family protein [Thermoanaerobacterium sp. DL9XJH110]|uniref:aspartyl-phosphate phosphatase Spo0E family protein n=1 Tax=Thermoanaerobacterium sp. DL9XJH110 TaxID=3386643 RepID=UPI003BB734E9